MNTCFWSVASDLRSTEDYRTWSNCPYWVSIASDWGFWPRFPKKHFSRAVASRESADWDSFMAHARWCSITFSSCSSRILDRVSGRMNRTRWTNSKACPFPWRKSLRFLSLRKFLSTVCATLSQSRPGLTRTYAERISDDSYDTWTFSASQAVTAQSFNFVRWSSRQTLWAFTLTFWKT
jgi:hypothetical protein